MLALGLSVSAAYAEPSVKRSGTSITVKEAVTDDGITQIKEMAANIKRPEFKLENIKDADLAKFCQAFPNVTRLSIKGKLTSIAPVAGLKSLTSFELEADSVKDMSPLANLKLTSLSVKSEGMGPDLKWMTGLTGLKDVEIRDAYRGSRAIQIGDLVGNEFEITVKDCTMDPARIPETVSEDISVIKKVGGFPNYFGVQRFGVVRPVTHLVGERLVRGDIEGAVRTYICFTTPEEDETLQEVRRSLEGTTDWGDAAKVMPEPMSFEKTMAQVLAGGGSWIDAIDAMPTNLQMMFVHAYQSYLFNEMLSLRIQRGLPINMPVEGDIVIPLDPKGAPQHENPVMTTAKNIDLVARQIRAGRAFVTGALFGSETMLAEGEMGEIERKVVEDNGLKAEDFVIPGLPKCSSKGGRRELMCPVKDIASEFRDDGYTLRFSLPKGNYATCLMREFMKSEMRDY